MHGIKAVGFDLDGTFLRTHVDYAKLGDVDRIVCESHGIPFSEITFTTIKRLRAPIGDWLRDHSRYGEFDGISREIDDGFTEVELEYLDEAEPYPGSLECLDDLRSRGLKVGMLTRGSYEYADTALRKFGVREKFDAVVGRDYAFYDDAKPSPKAMLNFAHELGVKPGEILYLGDNITDYMSARDAGAVFAGVLSGAMTRERWLEADPDMPIVDFAGDVVDLL